MPIVNYQFVGSHSLSHVPLLFRTRDNPFLLDIASQSSASQVHNDCNLDIDPQQAIIIRGIQYNTHTLKKVRAINETTRVLIE